VLHKCANPVCAAQFRYLHQGWLFEVRFTTSKAFRAIVVGSPEMAPGMSSGGGCASLALHASPCNSTGGWVW